MMLYCRVMISDDLVVLIDYGSCFRIPVRHVIY